MGLIANQIALDLLLKLNKKSKISANKRRLPGSSYILKNPKNKV